MDRELVLESGIGQEQGLFPGAATVGCTLLAAAPLGWRRAFSCVSLAALRRFRVVRCAGGSSFISIRFSARHEVEILDAVHACK